MFRCLALFLFATATVAQTFVVDAANGPGTNFTNLQQAVIAVPDGSLLLVRAGQYGGFEIDRKGLRVLADPGAFLFDLNSQVRVVNLTAQQSVTIRGFEQGSILGYPVLWLENNRGRVSVESMTTIPIGGVLGSFHVADCDDVRMLACEYNPLGFFGNTCIGSSLRTSRCLFANSVAPGLDVQDSFVELADTIVFGGSSLFGTPILRATNSDLRVLARSTLASLDVVTAIDGTGTVRIDPSVPVSNGGGTSFAPGIAVTPVAMPLVSAGTGAAGGQAVAALVGPAGAFGWLVLGLPAAPNVVVSGLDPLVVDPAIASVVASGQLSAPLVAGYVVPPVPLLLGQSVVWQGGSLDPSVGLQFANGVTYVHF